ncbi:hypothetical protein K437DRAFT_4879 [Tilletiaria anomala UBC 951]|uniref:Uncharacterized protein n=1 Tax=Tilletiaria anomala (strain ATCC 24038 / CBS 436.72 / UBC 951) TaxID=1037660 RepID=A0A066WF67_TILAU|nr:uncharacterized protein K437DRAFT_4879 [Tilletiaria anomala UBC 951]KDN52401.1 hypothetical protein K437DRAFT_4879 [Tilletiaria anomala UBC 951]
MPLYLTPGSDLRIFWLFYFSSRRMLTLETGCTLTSNDASGVKRDLVEVSGLTLYYPQSPVFDALRTKAVLLHILSPSQPVLFEKSLEGENGIHRWDILGPCACKSPPTGSIRSGPSMQALPLHSSLSVNLRGLPDRGRSLLLSCSRSFLTSAGTVERLAWTCCEASLCE